jgi:hypothetical protein
MFSHIDLSIPGDITFWAACLVAFFSFFRKSNLFPPSLASFQPAIHLSNQSVSFHSEGATLSINWSKTIQYRERSLHIPIPRIPGSPLCPSQALLLSQKISPPPFTPCPLFMYSTPRGTVPLTYNDFLTRLRKCLQRAGISPGAY